MIAVSSRLQGIIAGLVAQTLFVGPALAAPPEDGAGDEAAAPADGEESESPTETDAPDDSEAGPEPESEPQPESEPESEPEPEPKPEPEPEVDEDPEPEDDGLDDARDRFAKAAEHYELGEYGAAIEIFEALYRETRETTLLYNLGQAYWRRFSVDPKLEYLRQAASMFENYDKAMRGEAGYDPREVEQHRAAIAAQIAGIEASSKADLRPMGPSPEMLEYDRKRRMYAGMTAAGATLTGLGAAAGLTAIVGLIVRGSAGFALDQSGGGEAGQSNPLSAEEDAQLRTTYLRSGQMTFATTIAAGALLPVGITLLGIGTSRSKQLTSSSKFAIRPGAGTLLISF